jgi:hypothetical protein
MKEGQKALDFWSNLTDVERRVIQSIVFEPIVFVPSDLRMPPVFGVDAFIQSMLEDLSKLRR